MSTVDTVGIAEIRHADTDRAYVIVPEELQWRDITVEGLWRPGGVAYAAEVDHPVLGYLRWQFYQDAQAYHARSKPKLDTFVGRHRLVTTFDVSWSGAPPEGPDNANDEGEFRSKVDALVAWF